jgi:hypothetical protein
MSVAIIIPTTGRPLTNDLTLTLGVVRQVLAALGFRTEVYFGKHYGVDKAREMTVEAAVAAKHTHILFLDDDIVPENIESIGKLVLTSMPIAVGIYYEKNMRGLNLHYREGPMKYPNYRPQDVERWLSLGIGLRAVDAAGLGFALIDAEVFRSLSKPWFKFEDRGEDIFFAEKLESELGLKPVAVLTATAKHAVGPEFYLTWRGEIISVTAPKEPARP